MKIKMDFITNSSSSSFIIAFPSKIKTINDVAKFIPILYAKTIFKDAKNYKCFTKTNKNTIKKIATELRNGCIIDNVDYHSSCFDTFCQHENITRNDLYENDKWDDIAWDEFELKFKRKSIEYTNDFLKGIPNESYIYILEYSDNDGSHYSEIEHNNIFCELPHIRVYKH